MCLEEKLALEREVRQLRGELAAAQAAAASCATRELEDLLELEDEAAALGVLAFLVVASFLSAVARAWWFRYRTTIYPPDRYNLS